MTSIDELFKKPPPPGNKRKLQEIHNPNEAYKAAKLSTNGDVKGRQHHASVEEEQEDDEDDVAGPELPPEEDEEGDDDDEEGRFFGGGVSKHTKDVMDYIEEHEEEGVQEEIIDSAWLRRTAVNFEKKISKNQELRAKFEDDPQKFMASEADLDTEIRSLGILTDHPQLYEDFAKLGCVNSLVSLLAHDNTDIAINAVEIVSELTDEDVQAEQTQWNAVVEALLESELPTLLAQNLERLDESNETDRSGVYYSLATIENLASQASLSEKFVEESTLLTWLLSRIQKKESPLTENKQYAAEVLAILLQSSPKNRSLAYELDVVDLLLQLLSAYRKRDPAKDSTEEEYAENLFDSLTCLVDDANGKDKFLEAEGIELCLIMLREGKFSKPRALRLLDHALGGDSGVAMCEKFVDVLGLKTLFGLFMKKMESERVEHVLGILASLLRLLPATSEGRIRTLAKFMEKDYEKVGKLLSIRTDYSKRLQRADEQISAQRAELDEDEQEDRAAEWLSKRLDAGLFTFQTVDVILAWLAAEDTGARAEIETQLESQGATLAAIRSTLEEQLSGLEDGTTEEEASAADMLRTLVELLS